MELNTKTVICGASLARLSREGWSEHQELGDERLRLYLARILLRIFNTSAGSLGVRLSFCQMILISSRTTLGFRFTADLLRYLRLYERRRR